MEVISEKVYLRQELETGVLSFNFTDLPTKEIVSFDRGSQQFHCK